MKRARALNLSGTDGWKASLNSSEQQFSSDVSLYTMGYKTDLCGLDTVDSERKQYLDVYSVSVAK